MPARRSRHARLSSPAIGLGGGHAHTAGPSAYSLPSHLSPAPFRPNCAAAACLRTSFFRAACRRFRCLAAVCCRFGCLLAARRGAGRRAFRGPPARWFRRLAAAYYRCDCPHVYYRCDCPRVACRTTGAAVHASLAAGPPTRLPPIIGLAVRLPPIVSQATRRPSIAGLAARAPLIADLAARGPLIAAPAVRAPLAAVLAVLPSSVLDPAACAPSVDGLTVHSPLVADPPLCTLLVARLAIRPLLAAPSVRPKPGRHPLSIVDHRHGRPRCSNRNTVTILERHTQAGTQTRTNGKKSIDG